MIDCKEIDVLDLSKIKLHVVKDKFNKIDVEVIDDLETLYRSFLKLKKLYPKRNIIPSAEIDIFWHHHILHTKEYYADCESIFGSYLHHTPGGDTKADRKLLEIEFLKTVELVKKHFPEMV